MNPTNPIKLIILIITLQSVSVNIQASEAAKTVETHSPSCVVLLHGLARSPNSMNKMAKALRDRQYIAINEGYPSTQHTIQELTPYVLEAINRCRTHHATTIHFITHSMGGILVRYYLSQNPLDKLGRVVMLSPPNQGSEVVDKLSDVPGFKFINGPAGGQLGTDNDSVPNTLGSVDYPVGIITGNKSINLILSLLIPGEDDGKVSVKRAKVEGMVDFLVVPNTHPMIMRSDEVIKQTMHFLEHGKFAKE